MPFTPWPIHDWISVDDIIDGLLLLSSKEATGIYELGTGVGKTNQEVLDTVEQVTGNKANVRYIGGLRPYDTRRWVCDNSQGAREFGWTPKRDFVTTIQEMVDQYVESMSIVQ